MKTDNNFVRSGRERIADDNYQTVDPRCVDALLNVLGAEQLFSDDDSFIDCCSPHGSGILDELNKLFLDARPCSDAFGDFKANWIISNPPYDRSKVDKIIYRQLERFGTTREDNTLQGVAMLLRTGFDHAKTRVPMFRDNQRYLGQIKMLFRPKWFLDTDTTPIHNYVWHIWTNKTSPTASAQVWYW